MIKLCGDFQPNFMLWTLKFRTYCLAAIYSWFKFYYFLMHIECCCADWVTPWIGRLLSLFSWAIKCSKTRIGLHFFIKVTFLTTKKIYINNNNIWPSQVKSFFIHPSWVTQLIESIKIFSLFFYIHKTNRLERLLW